MSNSEIIIRNNLRETYGDVYSPGVIDALSFMTPFNEEVKKLMDIRLRRRKERSRKGSKLTFLNPDTNIPGTNILVSDARAGKFEGAEIPQIFSNSGFKVPDPEQSPMQV